LVQNLAGTLTWRSGHLDRRNAQSPLVVENDLPEHFVHAQTQSFVIRPVHGDAVRFLDRDENDEIDLLHRILNSGHPLVQVEPVRFLDAEKVGNQVEGASVKEAVSVALDDGMDRALKLHLEVFECRRVRERMAFFFELVVGLINGLECRKQTVELTNQGRLPGLVCSGKNDFHGASSLIQRLMFFHGL
jgi:hypothetical protein